MIELKKIADYVREKIKVSALNGTDYITTENMLPDRGGILCVENQPRANKATRFHAGDVLVSNIRPYFKKIWYADRAGGCSNDVLVFRAKRGQNKKFLYYVLAQDLFFDFMMAGANGIKMPRGNKKTIPKFLVPDYDFQTQTRIADILSVYDDLIENGQKQIKLLEEEAQRLYKEWFIDLHFPGHETTPISNGIPKGWRIGNIGEMVEFHDSMRKPLSSLKRACLKGKYRYYGAAGVIDHIEKYLLDGTYLLLGEDGSVITSDGFPVLQYVTGRFWVNNHAHVLTGKEPFTTEFIYMMFLKMSIRDVVTGVAQPKISQARLSAKKIRIPALPWVMRYQSAVEGIFKKILILEEQIENAREARDRLLPKLMSGEIRV